MMRETLGGRTASGIVNRWRRSMAVGSAQSHISPILSRVSTLTATLVLLVSISVAPATATNWGASSPTECNWTKDAQCVARDSIVDVYFTDPSNFWPKLKTSAMIVWQDQYNNHPNNTNTEIYIFELSGPTNADVWVFEGGDYNENNARAWTLCPNYATKVTITQQKTWCEPQSIYFNTSVFANTHYNSGTKRRAIACHEMGHIYGLTHRSSAYCMNSPVGERDTLGPHDTNCLVKYYPLTTAAPYSSCTP